MHQNKTRVLRIINWIALGATIIMNALADTLSLGGVKTGEVSDIYRNMFTPAPLTFAIWGVIYLLLVLFLLYQSGALDGKSGRGGALTDRIGYLFALSCVCNILWLVCWHFDRIGLSVILMFALLASLLTMLRRVRAWVGGWRETLCVRAPIDLYAGWVTIASIANVSVWCTKLQWRGWGLSDVFWTTTMLAIGAILAICVLRRERAWAYGIAIVWAYAGVCIRHVSADGYALAYPAVVILCIGAAIAVAVATVAAAISDKDIA